MITRNLANPNSNQSNGTDKETLKMTVLNKAKFLATTCTLALLATAANAADRYLVISDAMPKAAAKEVLKKTVQLMDGLEPGDRLTVIDGPSTRSVLSVALPSGEDGAVIKSNRNLKKKHFLPSISALKKFTDEAQKTAANLPANAVPMQVNVSGVLDLMALHVSAEPEIIFMGSSRYYDDRWPEFSMRVSFPNDAHVRFSPAATPFGAKGREGTLEGLRVHFCELEPQNAYVKPMQRDGLRRAIGLMVQAHGATLASFTSETKTCIDRAIARTAQDAKRYAPDPSHQQIKVYNAEQTAGVSGATLKQQRDLAGKLKLPKAEFQSVLDDIQKGTLRLAEVYLHDTDSEDGDVVTLVAGKVKFDVHLTKKPVKRVVPVMDGKLVVIGKRDGGGGITLGLRTDQNDRLHSPVMRVGQSIEIPFFVQS